MSLLEGGPSCDLTLTWPWSPGLTHQPLLCPHPLGPSASGWDTLPLPRCPLESQAQWAGQGSQPLGSPPA